MQMSTIFLPRYVANSGFLLGCWASAGYTAEGCAALEQQLRQCMDAPVRILICCSPTLLRQLHGAFPFRVNRANDVFSLAIQKPKTNKKNTINYHLMRMYPKVVGPKKREGTLG